MTKGSVATTFFVLIKGAASIINKTPSSQEKLTHEGSIVSKSKTRISFGELCLLDNSLNMYSNSVIAREDCHFAILDKKVYQKILSNAKKNQLAALMKFLVDIPIFSKSTEHMLKSWIWLFEKNIYNFKHQFYQEGEHPKRVYLIKSGQVLCKKRILVPRKFEDNNEVLVDVQNKSVSIEPLDPLYQEVQLCILGPGEIFGEDEVFPEFFKDLQEKIKAKKDLDWVPKMSSTEAQLLNQIQSTRETTMTLATFHAEIWSVPANVTTFPLIPF